MNPSGVQLASAIRPPGRQTRRSWAAAASWIGANPGYDVDARLTTTLRTMTEIWRGDRAWTDAVRRSLVTVDAQHDVARAVPNWVGQSTLAQVPRPERPRHLLTLEAGVR